MVPIQRSADHWVCEGDRSRCVGEGTVPSTRVLGSELLCVASKYDGMDVSDAKRLKALETENARVNNRLAESMLENEVTRKALRNKWSPHRHAERR